MAEENDTQEGDAEAEMLRTMQEELGDDDASDTGGDGPGNDAGGDDMDSLLEEEILKAMEQENSVSGDGADPMGAFPGGGAVADYSEKAEGIERLTDVEVEVTVELGDNQIPIQDIMSWATGSIVELQPEEHNPVKVLLNGSPFAMGEIVVVGDTFGVRIVELLDPPEAAPH